MSQHGIIVGFDEENNRGIFEELDNTPITLRMLLSHTSGHEYDWINPLLGKWRASRNEVPWSGPTVEHKSATPLVWKPGTGFGYSSGHEWAGKLVEIRTGTSLEDFMRTRIWEPLGIQGDMSFHPRDRAGMRDRMATLSTLGEGGAPPAADLPGFGILLRGATESLGGAGLYGSSRAYHIFLAALLRRDPRLLSPASHDELFRPQLDSHPAVERNLNEYFDRLPPHLEFLGSRLPAGSRRTWSLAGLVAREAQPVRCGAGTAFWVGAPGLAYYVDREAGVCGSAFCQVLPPEAVAGLHEEFQRGVYRMMMAAGADGK
jgi:CubicO group peptidase (beta-lactamase class C family)